MGERPEIFETARLGARRDRAMRAGFAEGGDVLWRIAADRLAERIGDTPRAFPRAAVIGTGGACVPAALPAKVGGEALTLIDPSPAMAEAAAAARPGARVAVDPCEVLPLEPGGQDLVLSVFLMHWLNDPVGHLVQLRRALKPDGLAIAALFGGRTLAALRAAFATAEAELLGGIGPRVAPMGELRDLGALLQRAGLEMPVADAETLRLVHRDALHLMRDLRAMGETSLMAGRARGALRRDVLARVGELLAEHAPAEGGGILTEFELVMLTGWAPGPGQPRPLRPGSAATRLADALGTVEIPAGEKAPKRGG